MWNLDFKKDIKLEEELLGRERGSGERKGRIRRGSRG
jgi:hypothetical protein